VASKADGKTPVAAPAALDEIIAGHNENPKPFVWTASTDLILGRVEKNFAAN
jgi:hypothetical protein